MACFHEPFGVAWYQGDDARAPRLTDKSPRKPGLTFYRVVEELQRAAESQPVFSKDMPQYTDHLWTEDFLAHI
jgi:adenylylsulfate kinase